MARVVDVLSSPVYVVDPSDTVSHASMTMLSRGVSRLVVMDGEKPAGMITKSDIAAENAQNESPEKRRPVDSRRVSRVMSGDLVTTQPSTGLEEAAERMLEKGVSGLPVVESPEERYAEEGDLLGIVTKHDVVDHFGSTGSDVRVNDIYTPDLVTVHRHSSLNKVVEEMMDNDIHRVVVMEDKGSHVGIITRSDLAFTDLAEAGTGLKGKEVKMTRKAETGGEKRLRSVRHVSMVAEDVMTEDVRMIDLEAEASEAAKLMTEEGISGLPVVHDGEVTGIVTKTDVVRAVAEGAK